MPGFPRMHARQRQKSFVAIAIILATWSGAVAASPPTTAPTNSSPSPALVDSVRWWTTTNRQALSADQNGAIDSILAEMEKRYGTEPASDQRQRAEDELVRRIAAVLTPSQIADGARATTTLRVYPSLTAQPPAAMPTTAASPASETSIEAAKKSIALSTIGDLKLALNLFELDTGRFPTTDEGLPELANNSKNVNGWHGPYISKLPLDPWGHPYVYRCPATESGRDFDLLSTGPDGHEGGGDDIGP
jgi:general secretion pathway protein G